MRATEILYEPLPVARFGIRVQDGEVLAAKDFSCLARLLEEYICHGAISIVMPSSAPEVKTIDQMPPLLAKRIRVVDDSRELEAVERLLFGLRREFKVRVFENSGYLRFPSDITTSIHQHVSRVHADLKRLALGFNHGIQVELVVPDSIATLRYLRQKVSDTATRIVLSQLECLFNEYCDVEFDSQVPKSSTTPQLISIFDRLVNDERYLSYSHSISRLALPGSRPLALAELREFKRTRHLRKIIEIGWNYTAKVLKVWTGVPLPEFKELAVLIRDKTLPPIIDMSGARKKAIEMWCTSDNTENPLRRDGTPVADEEINWAPPMPYITPFCPDDRTMSFGPVIEFFKAFEKLGFITIKRGKLKYIGPTK